MPFAWHLYARDNNREEANGFRNTFGQRVSITFIGVWDTVSSVRYAATDHTFAYTYSNPIVKKVRHAIALDERRAYFRQNLWKEPADDGQDVLQVWFPGVHCDIGGGYLERESGLSKITLGWMVDELRSHLAFHGKAMSEMLPGQDTVRFAAPSATAVIHESLRGLWHLAEFFPKKVNVRQPNGQYVATRRMNRGRPRFVPDDAHLHASVAERMAKDSTYRPTNLPNAP